ncbi:MULTISPECIES: HlyD family secretion protein [unclassified Endozoicomonas]|uniref:HlyD family secretion protein n=1 Tax=unclassified Endozoicomonas TaxID=2644528 RepID=UPI003BB60F89
MDLLVTEGHKVTVGSPMLRVKTDRQLVGGSMEKRLQEQLKVAIASFQQQISQQQQLAQLEKQRLALLQEDLKHQAGFLTEQIATQKQHADTLEQELKGLEILLSKGHLTQVDYNAKLTVLLSSKLDLQSLQKEKVSLYSRLTEAGNQYERVDVDTGVSLSSLQAVIAELRERSIETEGRSSYLITAPVSGTVTSVLVRKGGLIVPGRQILAILPEQSKLQAELYVPTRAIGFTTKGQPVQIRYPAFPYQKFGFHRGQVSDISRTIIAPDDIPAPASVTEPVYRITVALDHQSVTAFGEQYPLQSGMLLSADLMGESRSIIEWLLEPLYSLKGRSFFSG